MIGANAGHRVFEVCTVVNSLVHVPQSTQSPVSCPFIGPYGGAWDDDTLNYRYQRGSISTIHQLDVTMLRDSIAEAEHPSLWLLQLMATVVLGLNQDRFVDLHTLARPRNISAPEVCLHT